MGYSELRDELAMKLMERAASELGKGDLAGAELACKLCEAAESLPLPPDPPPPAPAPVVKKRTSRSRAKK